MKKIEKRGVAGRAAYLEKLKDPTFRANKAAKNRKAGLISARKRKKLEEENKHLKKMLQELNPKNSLNVDIKKNRV